MAHSICPRGPASTIGCSAATTYSRRTRRTFRTPPRHVSSFFEYPADAGKSITSAKAVPTREVTPNGSYYIGNKMSVQNSASHSVSSESEYQTAWTAGVRSQGRRGVAWHRSRPAPISAVRLRPGYPTSRAARSLSAPSTTTFSCSTSRAQHQSRFCRPARGALRRSGSWRIRPGSKVSHGVRHPLRQRRDLRRADLHGKAFHEKTGCSPK